MGWLTTRSAQRTRLELIPDFARYRELRLLDRFDLLVPVLLAASMLGLGAGLEALAPGLGTGPGQMLVWGFFISTVVLFHATCTINSLAHAWGTRRYDTDDDSRNNLWLALLTLGEGWHNNHHHYQSSCRNGFYWWEIDVTFYVIKMLSWVGLVWDIRGVPDHVLEEGLRRDRGEIDETDAPTGTPKKLSLAA